MEAPEDLARLCRAEWPRLVGALSLWTGDRGVAEELAQETLIRVCQRWSKVRTLDQPSGWAHRVALNLARSWARRQRVARRAQARLEHGHPALDAPDTGEVLAVRAALGRLPERQRAAVVLRYLLDLSVHDTAAVLGCGPNTVKTLCLRARRSLQRMGLGEGLSAEASDAR
jgi:RNA polymerase sigma-70 factor (ECF subfamily)